MLGTCTHLDKPNMNRTEKWYFPDPNLFLYTPYPCYFDILPLFYLCYDPCKHQNSFRSTNPSKPQNRARNDN